MKSKKILATLLVSTSIFSSMVSMIPAFAEENIQVVTQQEQEVNIPDLNLKKILNKKLGQAENTKITAKQLATIKELDIDNQNIASIEGLQYCVNLESLKLGLPSTAIMSAIKESNTISDISPLKGLKNLKHLQLSRLQITDFSPLKDLPLDLESSMIDPDSDDACFENIVHQLIANEDGSVTWENPDKDVLGNAMIPEDLCGGVYNKEDNTITWSKEAFKQHRESETGNNNGLDGVLECLTLTNESYTDNHMNLIVNHELQVKDFSEIVKTYHKVKDLFSSDATDEALFNSYVPLAANITQDQIDKAKEQVNSLSDQEYFVVDGNKKTGQDLQILIQK
ncbi:hypothetical protein ACGWJW_002768, partial [Enterococcus hirae]